MDHSLVRAQMGPKTGRVASLLPDWSHRYRFLHPALRTVDGELRPMRWSEVAEATGTRLDVATTEWHEVSSYRLHHPRPNPTFLAEPGAGPVGEVLRAILAVLATPTTLVHFAERTGWSDTIPGRAVAGAVHLETVESDGTGFTVWSATVTDLLALVSADPAARGQSAVRANDVWDPEGSWAVVADEDLASTYVGSREPMTDWGGALEWAAVDADAQLS